MATFIETIRRSLTGSVVPPRPKAKMRVVVRVRPEYKIVREVVEVAHEYSVSEEMPNDELLAVLAPTDAEKLTQIEGSHSEVFVDDDEVLNQTELDEWDAKYGDDYDYDGNPSVKQLL